MRPFSDADLAWFKSTVRYSDCSRRELARRLCERVGWHNRVGQLCLTDAYQALPKLADALKCELPALRGQRPVARPLAPYEAAVSRSSADVRPGAVQVVPVLPGQLKRWRAMMQRYHPRGEPQLPGQSLKYWIIDADGTRLGGLSFHAASWHCQARDTYIGWRPRARVAHLGEIVNNARFLLLPEVRVQGLASTVIQAAVQRLGEDWYRCYGEVLQLVYTYVDPSYSGYSYHCAGWHHIGQTSGRRCDNGVRKHVYAIGLQRHWRKQLCGELRQRFRAVDHGWLPGGGHWCETEYGASTHPDGRIGKRLVAMGQAWERKPGEATPNRFADEAACKAAYRLLSNKRVSMDDILESHRQATVGRGAQHRVVLAVQDTTTVNYDTMKHTTEGLTSIGGTAKGLCVHAQVAFAPNGRVLGVLDIDGEFRTRCKAGEAELTESARWVEGLATAAQYGAACGDTTRVVSVGDREADVWALLARQQALGEQVGCLLRVNAARQRQVVTADGQVVALRRYVESQPAVAHRAVRIEAQGGQRRRDARTAMVTLRIARVQLKAPGKRTETLSLLAVSAIEEQPPAPGQAPLNWLLLCSEGEASAANAVRICQWYEARWGIEEYFRVLKTGARLQQRQFDQADDLLKCMAFDAITAWRVFDLQRMAKCQPHRLACEVMSEDQIRVQYVLLHHLNQRCHPIRPPPHLTVRQLVVDLGRLAGFRPSRKQPVPGTKKLWQAAQNLMDSMTMFEALQQGDYINQNAWSSVSK